MTALQHPAQSPEEDDRALLERIKGGEAPAFEALMRRYNRRLYRVARAMLRDAAEAEDAVQEAYLCAFRAAGSFRGDSAVATWLTRIVSNECLSRLRKSGRREVIARIVPSGLPEGGGDATAPEPVSSKDSGPDAELMRSELRDLLERKIDELPQDFRTVFMLRCVEELSVGETALSLGLPEATVRSRTFRARGLLREAIAQELDMAQPEVFDFDGERCDRIVSRVLQAVRTG